MRFLLTLLLLLALSIPASAYDKIFYEGNKTLVIQQSITGKTLFTVQQVSVEYYSENGFQKMREVFNITSNLSVDYTFNAGDLGFNWKTYLGNKNITSVEISLFKPSNYSIVVNDTALQWQNTSQEVYNNVTGLNETVWTNITISVVVGNHTEIRDNSTWLKLNNLNGRIIKPKSSYVVAAVFSKLFEKEFSIKTTPSFMGVQEDRMTWWNFTKNNIINMIKPDGFVPYVMIYNASNSSGTSNATSIYFNGLINKNFSGMNVTDSNSTEENYTLIPKNDGTGNYWLAINWSKNGSKQIYFNEGNLGTEVGSASNPNATFTQASGRMVTDYKLVDVTGNSATANWQYWARFLHGTAPPESSIGLSNTGVWHTGDAANFYVSSNTYTETEVFNDGTNYMYETIASETGTRDLKMHKNNTMISYYINNTLAGTSKTMTISSGDGSLPNQAMGLFMYASSSSTVQDFAYLMPYTEPEPLSGAWSAAESQPATATQEEDVMVIMI